MVFLSGFDIASSVVLICSEVNRARACGPVIAEPIRRCVAPAAIASAKSAVIPAEIQSASGTTARTRSA